MAADRRRTPRQLRRLVEELEEVGLHLDGSADWHDLAVAEIDYAVRPSVHERRVATLGTIIDPTTDPDTWERSTTLSIVRRPVPADAHEGMRQYSDGISSWLIRRSRGGDEWAVFDRPAGSERDLAVLADSLGAMVVQRHPGGTVRIVGDFGVYRFDGIDWQHEPRVATWIDQVHAGAEHIDRDVLRMLLEFAVHDLGALGVGAILVHGPDAQLAARFESRLPTPPPLEICSPIDLAPLRHALGQIDGAAIFDHAGTLRHVGVRLVPSADAERRLAGGRGMRHISAHRYSYDDPIATVIVVSEDGPVTALRAGEILGASAPIDAEA